MLEKLFHQELFLYSNIPIYHCIFLEYSELVRVMYACLRVPEAVFDCGNNE